MENMILQPIVVGGQTFKNRIMFPPLTTGYEKNGMISEQDMGFYTRPVSYTHLRAHET